MCGAAKSSADIVQRRASNSATGHPQLALLEACFASLLFAAQGPRPRAAQDLASGGGAGADRYGGGEGRAGAGGRGEGACRTNVGNALPSFNALCRNRFPDSSAQLWDRSTTTVSYGACPMDGVTLARTARTAHSERRVFCHAHQGAAGARGAGEEEEAGDAAAGGRESVRAGQNVEGTPLPHSLSQSRRSAELNARASKAPLRIWHGRKQAHLNHI